MKRTRESYGYVFKWNKYTEAYEHQGDEEDEELDVAVTHLAGKFERDGYKVNVVESEKGWREIEILNPE